LDRRARREMGESDAAYLRGPRPEVNGGEALRFVDLFCGCGGLSLGAEEAARQVGKRLDTRLAVEAHEAISRTYRDNFPKASPLRASKIEEWLNGKLNARTTSIEQITKKKVGRVDLLVGGPPCQGSSTLNNHTRGDDPKNALYLRMVRAAEILGPEAILIENVPGIINDRTGVVDFARQRLETLGYSVDTGVVAVEKIGVAQARKRHVLLAHTNGFPSVAQAEHRARVTKPRSLRWALTKLSPRNSGIFDTPSRLSAENLLRAQYLHNAGMFDLPNHRYKSMYGRLQWGRVAQTITSGFGSPGQGRYLHPRELRTLTPHEAARIQFIPDWFDFSSLAHRNALAVAIGNVVPPKLGFAMTAHLLDISAGIVLVETAAE
jgi:DNA (cytosine-5)-methyltransferase 1